MLIIQELIHNIKSVISELTLNLKLKKKEPFLEQELSAVNSGTKTTVNGEYFCEC